MESEHETMILTKKKKRGEERHIGERRESKKSRIIKVTLCLIETHRVLIHSTSLIEMWCVDEAFCVVKTHKRRSNKIYKSELTMKNK